MTGATLKREQTCNSVKSKEQLERRTKRAILKQLEKETKEKKSKKHNSENFCQLKGATLKREQKCNSVN